MPRRDDRTVLDHGVGVWGSAAWRERAVAWLDERLAEAGIERTGDVSQPHLKQWSTALRAPTTNGAVWLKAAGPTTAFEVGLYELLHQVSPDHVLTPIATDTDRGWIVLPDGGDPLGDLATGPALVDALVTVLPRYARMQRDLVPHAGDLVALGVGDLRAAVIPARFDEVLSIAGPPVERHGNETERAALRQLAAMGSTVASWSERLAALPAQPSLDHNDLHPWNVLITGGDLATARFYDWGDSVVTHPFASMLVPLSYLAEHLGVDAGAPEIRRVRDAYLDGFAHIAPRAELVDALELACRLGAVARVLVWAWSVRTDGGGDLTSGQAGLAVRRLGGLFGDSYLLRRAG